MTALPALRVLHPFPSAVNAVLVLALALLAGGRSIDAAALGLGMLLLQFCIGAVNDVSDTELDAGRKPGKPIPAGLLTRRAAVALGAASGVLGLLLYALFGPAALLFAAAMLGIGLAYDLGLKRRGLGWACFALAFPLLPLSTWWIVAGTLPPRSELILPLAAVAGPALSLSNGIVDLERDAAGEVPTLAVRLGRRRAVIWLGVLVAVIYGSALISLAVAGGPMVSTVAAIAASLLAILGVALSAARLPDRRERGWQAQVLGLALLTVSWVAAVA